MGEGGQNILYRLNILLVVLDCGWNAMNTIGSDVESEKPSSIVYNVTCSHTSSIS